MRPNPRPVRTVLWLRTLAPHGINETQTEVIDRLRQLEADGRIAGLDVGVWGASMGVARSADRNLSDVHDVVTEFERWADDQDCTLRPAFERRSARVPEETRVVLPLLCLAVYEAEAIRAVYPHVNGEDVHTIHDGVDALESMTSRDEGMSGWADGETTPPHL